MKRLHLVIVLILLLLSAGIGWSIEQRSMQSPMAQDKPGDDNGPAGFGVP